MSHASLRTLRSIGTAVAALAPALVSPQATPTAQPSFPTGTEIVTVDVVVTGKDGQPVPGLTREDFRVSEDGALQDIVSFEAVHRPAPAPAPAGQAPALEPRASSNQVPPGREPASFVIVFDELHMTPAEAVRARPAVASFLETGVAPGDRVGLVGTSQGTRFTARVPDGREALAQALARLQGRIVGESARDYMSDYEAMRIVEEQDPIVTDQVMRRLLSTGEIRRDVNIPREKRVDEQEELPGWRDETRARASAVWARARARLEQTLGIVERSLESLAAAPGRKSLVLVSSGLVQDARLAAFRTVVTASRRANAAIYSLDARGLVGAGSGAQADVTQPASLIDRSTGIGLDAVQNASEGSEGLALDTGGFVIKNQNELAKGLATIARESRSYYLVGYTPTNRAADGRFRKIGVELAREGLVVRARRGYYAPGRDAPAAKAEGRDAALQRALDAPFDVAEIPLRALALSLGEAEPGKTRVMLAVEADVRGLAFAEDKGAARDTLEYLLLVAHRETGEVTRFDQQLELRLQPETRARYEREGFPITRELPLLPGPYQAKIVARDKNNGRVGSLTHDFDVPAPSGLRVSSLLLSDRLRDDGAPDSREPQLVARRAFPAKGLLHCRFEVYGAARDAPSGRPKLLAGFALRRSDGRVQAAMPETPLQPAADGSLSRSLGAPLDGAAPGRYEVIVIVTDTVSGQSAEQREPIVIEPLPRG